MLLWEKEDYKFRRYTGTGKTAAFSIPLLEMINPEEKNVQAVVLCPTRELAIQVSTEIRKIR